MTEEKNIDAEKKENQPQDKAADERLTDKQLDKAAGGLGFEDFLNVQGLFYFGATSGK